MKTLVASPFEDDAAEILEWGYGYVAKDTFLSMLVSGHHRVGQAFMNTLSMFDLKEYERLTGSLVDPFNDDTLIPAALDKLTSK